MFCSSCGSKNDEGNKYCISCGKELMPKHSEENIHNFIIRRSIKKDAQAKNKGPLYLGYIVFFISLIAVIIFLTTSLGTKVITDTNHYQYNLNLTSLNFIEYMLSIILIMIVSVFFNFGMSKASLDISRGKTVTTGSIFTYPIKKLTKFLKVLGVSILFSIILNILTYIPILGYLIYFILMIYFMPSLAMLMYIIIDKDIPIVEAVKMAINITKGHKVAYYALLFSFIGWYLLSIFTLGLLLIWVIPYLYVSISNYYLFITKEKEYKDATKGLSDGGVLGLTIGGYFVVIILLILLITIVVLANTEKIVDTHQSNNPPMQDETDVIEGEEKNVSGLNIYVPDNYKEINVDSYDKAYMSEDGNVVIGLITYDIGNNVSSYDYTTFYRESLSNPYMCGDISNKNINNYRWEILDCLGTDANIKSYININNGTLYLLALTYTPDKNIETVSNNIEKNLTFTTNANSMA